MPVTLFADESGTTSGIPCYTIGVLAMPTEHLDAFNEAFAGWVTQHGVVGEVHWKKVAKSHGLINLAIEALRYVLAGPATFSCIVVLKSAYRKWQSGVLDEAFYTTYSFVLTQAAKGAHAEYEVLIDDKSESYPKHDEALHVISNHMLNKIAAKAKLTSVVKSNSKQVAGIQLADLLTGAINAGHMLYLDPASQINPGKRLLLARLAATLGWESLHFDTWPNHDFNVWHFPLVEYRAVPATRMIQPNLAVPFVTASDLTTAYGTSDA